MPLFWARATHLNSHGEEALHFQNVYRAPAIRHQWKRCMQLIVLLAGSLLTYKPRTRLPGLETRLLHLEIGELLTVKRHERGRYQPIERR
jgi:hypothetical protein